MNMVSMLQTASEVPVLQLDDVCVDFHVANAAAPVRAVKNVSLRIDRGESIALVGESGCGKSTLGRVMVGLIEPTGGNVSYHGRPIATLERTERQRARRMLQMVFQNPYGALDPRFRIQRSVREPLDIAGLGTRQERNDKVAWALNMVGLSERHAAAYPRHISGGQQQRVGIARAIVTSPELLVCDEVTSALDVSVKIQIVELLAELRRKLNVAYVFISHDLGIVRQIASRIAVMYLGQIVELMDAASFYREAVHPYSRALLEAVPIPDPRIERTRPRALLSGDVPSPTNPPSGCAFRSRCPLARDICSEIAPPLTARGSAHLAACHVK